MTMSEKAVEMAPRNPVLVWTKKIVDFLLGQYLIIGFGVACVLAYYFPEVAARGGTIRSEYSIIYGAVAFIFLVSGMQLSPQKLKINLTNWRLHIIVQGMSFAVIPAIVLAIIHICIAAGSLDSGVPSPPILIGLLALACLPTTIASNVVMTRNAGGDDAAAIISVLLGNVVGAFLSPLLIYGFCPRDDVFNDWRPASPSRLGKMHGDIAKQLVLSVIIPMMVGQCMRIWKEEIVVKALNKFKLPKLSSTCLILLVWTTFSGAFKTGALQKLSTSSLLFDIFTNLILYVIFTLICFFAARPPAKLTNFCASNRFIPDCLTPRPMSREQTVAVCFCGAAKTTSLGIPLVSAMWGSADDLTRAYIQIPVLLYTIEQIFLAQILVYFFKQYLARSQPTKEEDGVVTVEETESNNADEIHNSPDKTDNTRQDNGPSDRQPEGHPPEAKPQAHAEGNNVV